MKQVESTHYNFNKYIDAERWMSYFEQIKKATALKPKSVLVIGAGDNIVPDILKKEIVTVKTFDYDDSTNPDYTGDILELSKIINKKYDLIICCQVLEHLPFEKLPQALEEIKKNSNNLILSLPYCHIRLMKINFKFFKFFNIKFTINIPKFYKSWQFDGQHYWEIGTKGYSKNKVTKLIERYFRVKESYLLFDNTYHQFFNLES